MSLKRYEEQLRRKEERIAEERRKAVERIKRETDALKVIAKRIRDAQKLIDRKAAVKLGDTLIAVLRKECPGFFDEDGQFDSPLLIGALLVSHDKLSKDASVAAKWIEAGEKHLPKKPAKVFDSAYEIVSKIAKGVEVVKEEKVQEHPVETAAEPDLLSPSEDILGGR